MNMDDEWQLSVGGRTKRALIRHFRSAISEEVCRLGYSPDDSELFDLDWFDAKAEELAAAAADQLWRRFDDFEYREGDRLILPAAADFVRQEMPAVLEDVWQDYLKDPLDGIDTLVMLASGTQPEISR